jgi:hypothetical protein
MNELWIRAFSSDSHPDDVRLGRTRPVPISPEQWWSAIDAVPGARIGPLLASTMDQAAFVVEIYDPAREVWRPMTLADGEARIEEETVSDRQSAVCRAAERLVHALDASIVSGDGSVLMWRGEWLQLS